MVKITNRMKRLKFIKEGSPNKFNKALKEGRLVPSAREMNFLEGLGEFKKKSKKRK